MYIVQVKNSQRFKWKELPSTNCKFEDLEDAIKLHNEIKTSANYAGMDVRIWSEEADHYVEVDA